jgi:predicted glycosyltransferase
MNSIDALFMKTSKVFGFFGYTTLMDCLELGCDYSLIPTPGQDEQIYLAKRHKKAPSEAFDI